MEQGAPRKPDAAVLEQVQIPLAVDRRQKIPCRTGREREPVRDEDRTVQRRHRYEKRRKVTFDAGIQHLSLIHI